MQWLFRAAGHLPLGVLHAIGAALGWLVYLASLTYRRRFQDHTRQAGLTSAQVRGAIASAGRLVTELPWVWLRPRSGQAPFIRWEGDALVEQALARGRGVMYLTPHVGCFECIAPAQYLRFGLTHGAMTALYRPSRHAWFDALLAQARSAPGMEPAPTTLVGVRRLLKALKDGRVVVLLPDQVPGDGLGVWAPFFGRPAYTMTLAVRLAQQTGATPLLTWGERLPQGQGYVVHVEPLDLPLDASPEEAATALNRAMEDLIRRQPAQYLWGYARYKPPRREG